MAIDKDRLIGIDYAAIAKRGAKNLMELAEKNGIERERRIIREAQYTEVPDLDVLVFEERHNPPLWRMETIHEGPNFMGIVKVWDRHERFLEAELRVRLASLFLRHGCAETMADARKMVAKMRIKRRGVIRLKDSQTRERSEANE